MVYDSVACNRIIRMANVHRLGDNDGNPGRGAYNEFDPADNPYELITTNKIPFLYVPPPTRTPLQQSIPYTIKLTFCPSLKILSLTMLIAISWIVLFIITCTMGINYSTSILQIDTRVLVDMGANVPAFVYDGEVYRLISAAFLHANLPHILSNLFGLLFIHSRLEACFGVIYLVPLYLVGAICGNILSVLTSNNPYKVAVGGSTALLGFDGALIAYLAINWSTLDRIGPLKCQLTCIMGMMVFFSLFYTISGSNSGIDVYGHLGGFVGGLFGGMLILPPINPQQPLTMKIVGSVVLVAYLLTTFLVFYLAKY